MEVINLKEFRKQIKRDNSVRKIRDEVKERIITLIENTDGYFETQTDLIEKIIQNIKDLI
ncbi:MAG: hypothetical protein KAV18_00315 [Candidatus Omnitrophica bacterium]|nr:hypothetical protein [Candidatus Omnitrophota bacterium]